MTSSTESLPAVKANAVVAMRIATAKLWSAQVGCQSASPVLVASRLSSTDRNTRRKKRPMGISPPAAMTVLSSLRCFFAAWASVRLDGLSVSRLPFAHTGSNLCDAVSRDPDVFACRVIALPNLTGPCSLLQQSEIKHFQLLSIL